MEVCDSVKIIAISCGMISLKVRYDYRMPRVKSHREMSYRAISTLGRGAVCVDTCDLLTRRTDTLTLGDFSRTQPDTSTETRRTATLVVPSYFACPNGAIARAAETRGQLAKHA